MKVTAEVYKNIKKGKAPTNLSKRTIRNVEKSCNYAEYRKKYCTKKKGNSIDEVVATGVSLIDNSLENYYFIYKKNLDEINKLLIITLAVNVICFAVLIGLIAW